MIIPFYSWVSHIHEGPQIFIKSIQIARYQDTRGRTAGLHPHMTGRALWKERGRGPAAVGQEKRVTNIIQKGAIVQLPYELWEMV